MASSALSPTLIISIPLAGPVPGYKRTSELDSASSAATVYHHRRGSFANTLALQIATHSSLLLLESMLPNVPSRRFRGPFFVERRRLHRTQ